MGRLRRFVLVATTVTGALLWATLPFHSPHSMAYPIIGLVAAIASAAVPWSPRIAGRRIGRIALAGWLALGLLGFAALAWRDLASFGVGLGGSMWWFVVGWLVAAGVVGQLVIAGCRPWDVYLGLSIMFSLAVPFLGTRHDRMSTVLGMFIMAFLPLICAAITRAIQRRVSRAPHADLPDARVL